MNGSRPHNTTNARGDADHLREIRAEEAVVDEVERSSQRLLKLARQSVGIGDEVGHVNRPKARSSLALALALFVGSDQLVTTALSILGPEIRASLGMSDAAYGIIVSQRNNAAAVVALIMVASLQRVSSRKLLVMQAVILTGLGGVLSSLSASFWPLFLAVAISGPTAGVVWALHRPMIMDGYQPGERVRKMSLHQSGLVVGAVVAPGLIWVLTGPLALTWRGVLLVVGLVVLAAGLLGWPLLKEPVPGQHDTEVVRSAVQAEMGGAPAASVRDARLGYFETMRRLWLVPTFRKLLFAWAVLGVVFTPLLAYVSFLLANRWGIGTSGRSLFFSVTWLFAIPAFLWFAPRADRMFNSDPARLMAECGSLLVVMAVGFIVAATIPFIGAAVGAIGVTLAASMVLTAALMVITLSIVHPKTRPHAGALVAVFLVVIGGQGGAMLLGGLDRRFGPATAIAILAAPTLAAAFMIRRAAPSFNTDLNQMLESVIEQEEVASHLSKGHRLPLLSCRHIDFSYGQLQVLFDVSFTVDDGEMVALLGTNGAGKSTLLRVISGLGFPTRGSVRLRGTDISYIDAEKRVALGIGQVPGGRAVFPTLTVVENLRVFGYMHGRDRRSVENGIDATFDAFPALRARLDHMASTLSGGEQQMLGLGTAFIVRPRILLIDELSLGLAPRVVGELLKIVRRINDEGTAVVLVEQSVNVALSLVEHAYFMEKGAVRFDGSAQQLLSRPDLLRSVFLEGASKGLKAADAT